MNYVVKSRLADCFYAQAMGLKIKNLNRGNSLFCAKTVETGCKQPVKKIFLDSHSSRIFPHGIKGKQLNMQAEGVHELHPRWIFPG